MAVSRSGWELFGKMTAFLSLAVISAILAGWRGYDVGFAAGVASVEGHVPLPIPPDDHHGEWTAISTSRARSYGFPESPRDGRLRYATAWRWEADAEGCYRYIRVRDGAPIGDVEVKHEPLPDVPAPRPKPGGKVGEAPP